MTVASLALSPEISHVAIDDGVHTATLKPTMSVTSEPEPIRVKPQTSQYLRVTIVGGGFTGVSAAVQLVRACRQPLEITIVEPRPHLGRGLAYSTDDNDHRLNSSIEGHLLDPSDWTALRRWCNERNIVRQDPDALAPDGCIFIRRKDFGEFIGDILQDNRLSETGSTINHLRDIASDISVESEINIVRTKRGSLLKSELLIIATGNAHPRLPYGFPPELAGHPAVVAIPSDLKKYARYPERAKFLS